MGVLLYDGLAEGDSDENEVYLSVVHLSPSFVLHFFCIRRCSYVLRCQTVFLYIMLGVPAKGITRRNKEGK